MRNQYRSARRAQAAFFAHRMAVAAGILTPVPYISYSDKKKAFIKKYGSFKSWEVDRIGGINGAERLCGNGFLLRSSVIRLLIFSYAFGIKNSLRDIYWHKELSEFVFTNFDDPFAWSISEKYMRLLDESPPAKIEQEGELIWKKIHTSKGLYLFGRSDFVDRLPRVFERLELFRCGLSTTK
jgi:hypothetical protein